MKKKSLLVWGIALAVFALIIVLTLPKNVSSYENINNEEKIEIYKSLACGCCDVYSSYVKSKVSSEVRIFNIQDSNKIKDQYGVPSDLESCHTTIVGGYFVEGHVPLEAVEKLLSEQPDIAGIGMPGMPSGSPGMPGTKQGDFVIYGANRDGSTFEFMRM